MCGIVLSIRSISAPPASTSTEQPTSSSETLESTSPLQQQEWNSLTAAVADRGPDYSNTVTLETTDSALELKFHATVLHLRGEKVTPQPFRSDDTGDVLCWNGEIFDSPSLPVEMDENDGQKLFSLIESIGFLPAMKRLEGPHALIYYSRFEEKIYFTRDCLGRRSLLKKKKSRKGEFVLTSTSTSSVPGGSQSREEEWEEISCEGIWELDLKAFGQGGELEEVTKLHKRYYESEAPPPDSFILPFNRLNRSLPTTIGDLLPMTRSFPPLPVLTPSYLNLISTFKSILLESIRQRVLTIPFQNSTSTTSTSTSRGASGGGGNGNGNKPRIGILFSGGLDCTSIALLVDEVLPRGEGIDLINVAFENPRKLGLAAEGDGENLGKKKKKKETKKERQDRLKREERGEPESVELEQQLEEASTHSTTEEEEGGGRRDEQRDSTGSIYDVPDRLTGLETWRELCELRTERRWNFVQVDVPYREMVEHRQKVIDLMKPQDTVMDLSIAIAFYFASRGKGSLATRPITSPSVVASPSEPYTSTARVLLSGLGADELLGGYSRHRKAYNQYQSNNNNKNPPLADSQEGQVRWKCLIEELQMDLSRISSRNLGRDDRIISSNSKEVRYPFLSSPLVKFLSDLKIWEKCDFRFEEGLGEKLLLRMLVRDLMSVKNEHGGSRTSGIAWKLKKRAIHFGARTAKMEAETGRAKGTDRLS